MAKPRSLMRTDWTKIGLPLLLVFLGGWGLGSCDESSEASTDSDKPGIQAVASSGWEDIEPLTWPVARELIYGKALADQRGYGPPPRPEGLEHIAAMVREHPHCVEAHEVYLSLWSNDRDGYGQMQAEYEYQSLQHPNDPLLRLLAIRAAVGSRPFLGDADATATEVEAMIQQGAPMGLSMQTLAMLRSIDSKPGGAYATREKLEEQWGVETDPWMDVYRAVWDKDEAGAIEAASTALRSSPWLWSNPGFFSSARGHGADRTPLEEHIVEELDALLPQHLDDPFWISRAAEYRAALGDDTGYEDLRQRMVELDPAWHPMVAERWAEERLVYRGLDPAYTTALHARSPTGDTLDSIDEALQQYAGTPLELELAQTHARLAQRLAPPRPDLVLESFDRLDALGGLGWLDQVRRIELLLGTGEDYARAVDLLDGMEAELAASPVTRTASNSAFDVRSHPVEASLAHRRGMTAVVLQMRGWALHHLDRSDEGVAVLRQAVLLDELHPLAWSRLAAVERALGHEQAAVLAGVRALLLNSPDAAADREWIEEGVARLQPGWDDLDRFLEAERMLLGPPGGSRSPYRTHYWDLGAPAPGGAEAGGQPAPCSICGSPLPPFSLALAAGGELTAEDLPGQVTAIVNWDDMSFRRNGDGTIRYRQRQDELLSACGTDRVHFVALSTGSQRERVRRIVREDEITIDVALSADLLVDALLLQYEGTAAVVDRKGLIRFVGYTKPYLSGPEEVAPFCEAILAASGP